MQYDPQFLNIMYCTICFEKKHLLPLVLLNFPFLWSPFGHRKRVDLVTLLFLVFFIFLLLVLFRACNLYLCWLLEFDFLIEGRATYSSNVLTIDLALSTIGSFLKRACGIFARATEGTWEGRSMSYDDHGFPPW